MSPFKHDLRANASGVCREGKPVPTCPGHALTITNETPAKTGRFEAPSDFLTFLWWREPLGAAAIVERNFPQARLTQTRARKRDATFIDRCALSVSPQQRIPVVGNRNIDGDKKSSTRKPGQPKVGTLLGTLPGNDSSSAPQLDAQKIERPRVCGAMAQQCGDSGRGNDYAPQKFVHLVGYRDPSPRPETWVRPRPAPTKP
jgi:hypothetical protein